MTRHAAFYCGLAAFVVVGSLGGSYLVTGRLLNERLTQPNPFGSQPDRFEPAGIQSGSPPTNGQAQSISGPITLPQDAKWLPLDVDETATMADATPSFSALASSINPTTGSVAKAGGADNPGTGNAPKPLAPPQDAVPITHADNATNQAIRAIIEQELPNASREAKDIWFEELAGLSPVMVREILQIRNQFGNQTPLPRIMPLRMKNASDTESPAVVVHSPPIRELTAGTQSGFPAELQTAVSAIQSARRMVLQNIANANTVGYQRLSVLMPNINLTAGSAPDTATLVTGGNDISNATLNSADQETIIVRTVHSPGRLIATGRELDIAVEGTGYFRIQHNGENLYTRVGAFEIDASGQVVLVRAGKLYVLQPTLTVPQGTSPIRIAADGLVTINDGDTDGLTEIGRIELAHFVNPDGLELRDGNLFAETEQSGVLHVSAAGHAGAGTLQQRFLEASNVSVREELAQLKRLTMQMRAIAEAARISDGQESQPIGE